MIQAKSQEGQVRLDNDKGRLNDLLDRYGCTATDAGWRRLCILLALEVGDLERVSLERGSRGQSGRAADPAIQSGGGLCAPTFRSPHHFPHLTEALVVEASKAGHETKSETLAAEEASTFLADKLAVSKKASSVRAQYGQHKKLVHDLISEGSLAKRPWSALDLLSAYPPQKVGEEQLRDALVQRLAAIAATMNYDPSGQYGFDKPLQLLGDTYLQFITLRCGAEVQRMGAPARGSDAGAVELMLSRPNRIPWKSTANAEAFSLETFTTERLKPKRCQLLRNAFYFEAKHAVLGLVQLTGELRNDELVGELMTSPPQRPSVKLLLRAERRDSSL